jgi:hypothetical protein
MKEQLIALALRKYLYYQPHVSEYFGYRNLSSSQFNCSK